MKKKWLTMLLAASMVASMGTVAFAEEETEAAPSAVTTVGPEDGTHFELWSSRRRSTMSSTQTW
ncbi:MAG: hypothetical protein ACLTSZ_09335 [Lachnospiraceae bacterium]